jgi:hypothetical protein
MAAPSSPPEMAIRVRVSGHPRVFDPTSEGSILHPTRTESGSGVGFILHPRVDPKPEKVHDCVYFSPAYPFSSHRCIRYISRTATVVALGTPHPSRHPSLSSTGQVGDASQAHRSAP